MVVDIFDVVCGSFEVVGGVVVFGDEDVVVGVGVGGFVNRDGGVLVIMFVRMWFLIERGLLFEVRWEFIINCFLILLRWLILGWSLRWWLVEVLVMVEMMVI